MVLLCGVCEKTSAQPDSLDWYLTGCLRVTALLRKALGGYLSNGQVWEGLGLASEVLSVNLCFGETACPCSTPFPHQFQLHIHTASSWILFPPLLCQLNLARFPMTCYLK